MQNVTILGSGGMGTACAVLLAERPDRSVRIWTRHAETAARINQARENARLLPGIPLAPNITVTADIAEAVNDTARIVAAIPTAYLRSTLTPLAGAIPSGVPSRPPAWPRTPCSKAALRSGSTITSKPLAAKAACRSSTRRRPRPLPAVRFSATTTRGRSGTNREAIQINGERYGGGSDRASSMIPVRGARRFKSRRAPGSNE